MKTYTTVTELWINGEYKPEGAEVTLSDAASKYLKHALREKELEAPVVEASEPSAEAPAEEVESEDKQAKRAKVRRDGDLD